MSIVNNRKSIKEATFADLQKNWPVGGFSDLLRHMNKDFHLENENESPLRLSFAFLDSGIILKENKVTKKALDNSNRIVYIDAPEFFSVLKHKLQFKHMSDLSQLVGKKGILYFENTQDPHMSLFALFDGYETNLIDDVFNDKKYVFHFCHLK